MIKMEKLFVIKIGRNVIDNEANLSSFLDDFAAIKGHKILIHGGGKIATKIGDKLGIESKYVNGRRITDTATIDLVTMVYGGLVNKQVVAKLQARGCNAVTGTPGRLRHSPARGTVGRTATTRGPGPQPGTKPTPVAAG